MSTKNEDKQFNGLKQSIQSNYPRETVRSVLFKLIVDIISFNST